MKQIDVKLRKNWHWVDTCNIHNWSAPIGAYAKMAEPEKRSSNSFSIYIFKPFHDKAQQECVKVAQRMHGSEVTPIVFAGYEAYSFYAEYCRGALVMFWIFMEIEDEIVNIVVTGTPSQISPTLQWIDKHMSLGEEIPDCNGNPLQGGMPLVPPTMLFQMVDFTQEDYEYTAAVYPLTLPYFDFIVRASLAPATSVEGLVDLVNLDYSRHYGFREIDYTTLSSEAQEKLKGMNDYYIGTGAIEYNAFGRRVQKVLFVGFTNDPIVKDTIEGQTTERISKLVLSEDIECEF